MSKEGLDSIKQDSLHKEIVYGLSNKTHDSKSAPSYFREEVWVKGGCDNWHAVMNDVLDSVKS